MSDIGEQMMRPIIGIEYRTAQEAFDIMCERFRSSAAAIEARDAEIARLKQELDEAIAVAEDAMVCEESADAEIARLREALTQARIYLKPFSAMPVGAPGSIARQQQSDSIAAFEIVLAALRTDKE